MKIRDYMVKYSISNSDWGYVDCSIKSYIGTLYGLMEFLVNDYYNVKYGSVMRVGYEGQLYESMMNDCRRLYSGVTECFVRKVVVGDSGVDVNSYVKRCMLDPWNRVMPVYNGQVCNMKMYDGDNLYRYDSVYSKGYKVLDYRSSSVSICGVNVTSIEGEAVYCLDGYVYSK